MKLIFATCVIATCITATVLANKVAAHDFSVGPLDIAHPWSRPTPNGVTVAGGYLSITNRGKTTDRLIASASPVASRVEVHEVVSVDGAMKARPIAGGLEIKPGKTVVFKPGSHRIVLVGLKRPFRVGELVKGTLTFEKAGTVEIEYAVEASPAAQKSKGPANAVPAAGGASPSGTTGMNHQHHQHHR
jgi:copper(I)-binding protein